ncbi:biotin--[acetyl-CoA-carboxylase] ligase [Synechococcus sp. Nb3U1]|uniref:biotin--[acetyl-CoA-carboxylase] ligase n=1 Tax=Synechococcus sp. Nb3U1 TaxID=1914529 RepID=UPI001F288932|nr:biotin--[acetyl-CoA-carboxylase] ligase [Synechococcus sp. Nb3U1]MCF2969869.1 biotin--[acetyl-CoA-carboxylase] ligase [Synechococcus sp. Nb3U1]
MLSPSRLGSLVGRGAWGQHLLQVATTDSTNRLLLDWGRHFPQPLPLGTVLVSTRQRAGRGQHGRVWQSEPGGLYLSVWLGPPGPGKWESPESDPSLLELTLALAWGVVRQLRQTLGIPLGLKWPNDLVVVDEEHSERLLKLGGILLQSRFGGAGQLLGLVAGCGLNLNNGVPQGAISLSQLLGSRQDRTWVGSLVLRGMERGFRTWQQSGFQPIRWEYESWMIPTQVDWPEAEAVATVLGLAEDGRIRVQPQGELHSQQRQSILTLSPDQVRLSYHIPVRGSL